MKRKIIWLLLSYLVILSLLLASCASAAPVTPTTPTTPATPTAPTTPTTPTTTTAPVAPTTPVPPAAEKPKYGGSVNLILTTLRAYAPVLIHKSSTFTLNLTNDSLWGGDWAKGPAGANQISWVVTSWDKHLSTMRLAESYELVGDDTLIYHLRKGVHYGLNPKSEASRLVNGREMTADDVVASINGWFFDPEGHWQARVVEEERPLSVKALDKYTVEIKVRPGQLSTVFYYTGSFSNIYPPEVYAKYNKMRDWKHSVGTGPFLLTDVVEGSSVTFVRNLNYWDKDPIGPGKGQQLPYLDGVKFMIIADKSTQQAAFRTGKVDILTGDGVSALSWEDALVMIQQRPEAKYTSYLSRSPDSIGLRVDKPELPWYNKTVRQALVMAINYDTIIKDYFKGNADLVYPVVPYPENLPMYTPMAEQNAVVRDMYTYQPEKAKKILAEAGYPNGFKIEVVAIADEIDFLSIIKAYWQKVGVDLVMDVKERAVKTSITEGFQHKHAATGGASAHTLFAFHPTNPTDTANIARVNDSYANQVYDDTRADYIFDSPKLWPMMKEFFKYAIEQAWYIQFPAPATYHMWWPWVKNYHGEDYIGVSYRLGFVKWIWVDQALKKQMGY
ncbi:MAG: ABC transporter substrate-binding protein [Chloroflexi bacterium]|nr:ABC transporter substrate-binding protein [Chloroflexota bacterium]